MLEAKERILLNGTYLWYFAAGMLGPLFAVFAQKIGGDILELSSAWATYLIVSGILIIIIGRLSDSFARKEIIMIAGYALNAACTFGYLFVSTPLHLFLVEAGLGIASALAWPTWDALYAKYENKDHDGYTWGLAAGGEFLMSGIALIVGGAIVAHFSFKTLFIVMGSVQTIATLYQARILAK